MRVKKWLLTMTVVVAAALMLTGCGPSGTSYLALTYSIGNITSADFPALPPYAILYFDTYYEHPDGEYYGEYVNDWNFVLHQFWYTIEENLGRFLAAGYDRYYTMWLEPGGPELYYENVSASLAAKGAGAAAHNEQITNAPIDTSRYDLSHPEPFSYERSSNGVTFRVRGNSYKLKQ